MASYDTGGASFSSGVRKLLASDWAHADVLNETIGAMVNNEVALQTATFFVRNVTIKTTDWQDNAFSITDDRVTAETAADVYVASASKEVAAECGISGETKKGKFVISCNDLPGESIVIDAIVFRNEVTDDAG